MIVYPAIDIYGGRVVRMTRGDFSTVEEVAPSPLAAAKRLVNEGAEWLHIVDIDGARTGEPANLDAIRQIANRFTVKIQAGGGIRDFDTAEAFAEAGASRIVVGTAAIEDPELIGRLVDRHADGMAVAVDARNGMVMTAGWTETSETRAVDLMQRLALTGVPGDPLVGGPSTDASGARGDADRPAMVRNPIDQQGSTGGAGPCSTVKVHPGLLSAELEWLRHHPTFNRRTPGESTRPVNNLLRLHT